MDDATVKEKVTGEKAAVSSSTTQGIDEHLYMSEVVDSMFAAFREELDGENELKENIRTIVKDLEQKLREILLILQKIHHPKGLTRIGDLCSKTRAEFDNVRTLYEQLNKCISAQEYFKYADLYRWINQRFVFVAALLVYLESETMISKEDAAKVIGISANRSDKFYLDLEDYLSGLLQVAPELSRLAVNCVTVGDYDRPLKIAAFLNDLDAGFRLLNLKNDALRKRFDGLKYEVKKVEEVVYDLTIRGLLKSAASNTTGSTDGESGFASTTEGKTA